MKTKYAQVGIGSRGTIFYNAIAGKFKDTCELTGFCDVSPTRMEYANKLLKENHNHPPVPMYLYTEFEKMIDETKPDVIIVTSVDRTHDEYIIRAMEKGCDVIVEKPMTTDEIKAQAVIDAMKRTGRKLRVTFNARYGPSHTKIRELIVNDTIGDVFSVHFEWLLDINHGADYYRRWHRNKANSGGLLVHKSTHHFDMVNFWLGAKPETVFAFGALNFYGRHNAEKRGVTDFYYRSHGSPNKDTDPFAIDMENNPQMKAMYLDAEKDSGYIRDRSVFSDDIGIEDTMALSVRYNTGAVMSYSLNSYMPWEGFNVALNGSKGRIEYRTRAAEKFVNIGKKAIESAGSFTDIIVFPMFGEPYEVPFDKLEGSHGGSDDVMLQDIFGTPQPDPFNRAAGLEDGLMSILTGIAANKSIASGLPCKIADLIRM